jgi:hypothetical protein
MMTKTCTECRVEKPKTLEFYYKEGNGFRSACKPCHNKKNNAWREANREKDRINSKRRYENNKIAITAQNKEWYLKNKEKVKARVKERRLEKTKAYLLANPEEAKAKADKAAKAVADKLAKLKYCKHCDQTLSIDLFTNSSRSRDGKQFYCRDCANKKHREHQRKHIETYRPRWREAQLRKIGFTPELFDEMLESQGNVCALCGSDKPGGRWNRFFADHNHETGKARGVLCFHCNTALGIIEARDANWTDKAKAYLEQGGFN